MGAKDKIKAQVRGAVTDYYKDRLELQKDLEPKADASAGDTGTGEGETGTGEGKTGKGDADTKTGETGSEE